MQSLGCGNVYMSISRFRVIKIQLNDFQAGFLLPILKGILTDAKLARKRGIDQCVPACLILSPTRELAVQIAKEAHMYAAGTGITTDRIYGGTSYGSMETGLRVTQTSS